MKQGAHYPSVFVSMCKVRECHQMLMVVVRTSSLAWSGGDVMLL